MGGGIVILAQVIAFVFFALACGVVWSVAISFFIQTKKLAFLVCWILFDVFFAACVGFSIRSSSHLTGLYVAFGLYSLFKGTISASLLNKSTKKSFASIFIMASVLQFALIGGSLFFFVDLPERLSIHRDHIVSQASYSNILEFNGAAYIAKGNTGLYRFSMDQGNWIKVASVPKESYEPTLIAKTKNLYLRAYGSDSIYLRFSDDQLVEEALDIHSTEDLLQLTSQGLYDDHGTSLKVSSPNEYEFSKPEPIFIAATKNLYLRLCHFNSCKYFKFSNEQLVEDALDIPSTVAPSYLKPGYGSPGSYYGYDIIHTAVQFKNNWYVMISSKSSLDGTVEKFPENFFPKKMDVSQEECREWGMDEQCGRIFLLRDNFYVENSEGTLLELINDKLRHHARTEKIKMTSYYRNSFFFQTKNLLFAADTRRIFRLDDEKWNLFFKNDDLSYSYKRYATDNDFIYALTSVGQIHRFDMSGNREIINSKAIHAQGDDEAMSMNFINGILYVVYKHAGVFQFKENQWIKSF